MADTRVLKVGLAADISDFSKGLDKANKESESFGDKLGNAAKAGALALAAAGAAAIKVGIELAKNAAEDAAAQRVLALTLENTTKATDAQVAAVEKYISATSLAFGVTDDQLRPAFARLTRSTKDVEESQKLLNLALDISTATGKPLETIATGLSKAYDGNTNALGKLGLGIDQSIIKSKDFDAVYTSLRENFKGFAEQEANTFEGKLRRLQVAFDEGKETVGAYILDAVTPLVTLAVDKLIPAFETISTTIGEKVKPAFEALVNFYKSFLKPVIDALIDGWKQVRDAFADNADKLQPLLDLFKDVYNFLNTYVVPIIKVTLVNAVKAAATAISAAITVISPIIEAVTNGIRTAINAAITGINLLISAYNAANNLWGGKDVAKIPALGSGGSTSSSGISVPSASLPSGFTPATSTPTPTPTPNSASGSGSSGGSSSGASSGSSNAAVSGSIGSFNAGSFRLAESASMESLLTQGWASGSNAQFGANTPWAQAANNITINMGVVGDPAGAARAVQELLNNEATISGNYLGGVGSSRFATVAV